MRHSRLVFAPLFLACFLAPLTWSQPATGSLYGSVIDPAGAAIPNAPVRLRHEQTGVEARTITTDAGVYTFPSLAVGPYSITVEQPGFKKAVRSGIVIEAATRSSLDVALEVGQVTETIEVSTQPALLQSTTSELGTVFAP